MFILFQLFHFESWMPIDYVGYKAVTFMELYQISHAQNEHLREMEID